MEFTTCLLETIFCAILIIVVWKMALYSRPRPPELKDDWEEFRKTNCIVYVCGKQYNGVKKQHSLFSYHYDAYYNVIETRLMDTVYEIEEMIKISDLQNTVSIVDDSGECTECYISTNMRVFISKDFIKTERIYRCRKPWWKNMKKWSDGE